ncbi:MAG: hypothetical protein ABL904_12715 [Hyphomicrobiaceae bacterium]
MRRPWSVLASLENSDGTRCVDIFVRDDGSYGFEEFRRDPEDGPHWRITGNYASLRHATRALAEQAARRTVGWLT